MNESFIAESIAISANQRTTSIIWMVFVTIGLIMSGAQMVVICAWKPLRTFEQILIFFVAASDFFKSLAYGMLGIQRIYLADNGLYDARTQLECLQQLLPGVVSLRLVMVSMLTISLDRLIALTVPVWYSHRKRRIKIAFVIVSVLMGVGYGSLLMIGGRSDVYQLSCVLNSSPTPTVRKMLDYADNICCGVVVLINVISCSFVYYRLRKAMRANENMHIVKKNMQLNAVKTLVAIMILFIVTVYADMAWNAMLANLRLSDTTKRFYGPFGVCMNLLRSIFDFPIYLIMCREYRTGFRQVFIKKLTCDKKNNSTVAAAPVESDGPKVFTRKIRSMTTAE